MLSDSSHQAMVPGGKDRAISETTNKRWSDAQKMEAVQSYLLLGNLALVGRLLGIPEITLRVWKASNWWKDVVEDIKTQEKIELSAKMRKLVSAGLAVVEDRLENGDYQYDQKSGQVVRKPVSMKDAHKVAVDLQARQEVMERSERPELSDEGVENKLLKLAEKFADMATKKIEQRATEHRTVDVSDAVIKDET